MNISQYAKSIGADRKGVQRAIKKGLIILKDGKIDKAQADAAWAVTRQGRRTTQDTTDDGRRSANARIGAAFAKLRLATDRFEQRRDRYVERGEAVQVWGVEADYILDRLRAAPAHYGADFAATLGIEELAARRILARFMALANAEVGDLRAEAVRAAEAA